MFQIFLNFDVSLQRMQFIDQNFYFYNIPILKLFFTSNLKEKAHFFKIELLGIILDKKILSWFPASDIHPPEQTQSEGYQKGIRSLTIPLIEGA